MPKKKKIWRMFPLESPRKRVNSFAKIFLKYYLSITRLYCVWCDSISIICLCELLSEVYFPNFLDYSVCDRVFQLYVLFSFNICWWWSHICCVLDKVYTLYSIRHKSAFEDLFSVKKTFGAISGCKGVLDWAQNLLTWNFQPMTS